MGYLRIILALSVVIFHTSAVVGYIGINGIVAVHIFFIISGFYMALILKNKYLKSKNRYYTFITNRFLRIYPLYWLILLLTILVDYFQIHPTNIYTIMQSIYNIIPNYVTARHPLGVVEDITLLVRFDYFSPSMLYNDLPLVSPAWTLVLELIFYLLAPLLMALKKRYILLLTLLSLCIHFITSHFYQVNGQFVSDYFFLSNFFFFLFGILSYYLSVQYKNKGIFSKYSMQISLVFLLSIFMWNYIPEVKIHWIILKEWSIYLLTPFVIPLLFNSFAKIPLNNFMANLSYPVYISHNLIIIFLQQLLNYKKTSQYFSVWTICLTLIFSILLVYFIEKPIDQFRQSRIKKLTLKKSARVAKMR